MNKLLSWLLMGITLLLLLLLGSAARAQDPGSGGPQPGTPAADPTTVPLDGGASLLLMAGAGLSLRYLRRRPLA